MNSCAGSSPRVRGAGCYPGSTAAIRGIIPACAGSRSRLRQTAMTRRDHPRVCGEQTSALTPYWAYSGSSPRVRGAVTYSVELELRNGIIPACAGSSRLTRRSRCSSRDHPRVCGEQVDERVHDCVPPGSSPRVRGAACASIQDRERTGIIPACAGSRGVVGYLCVGAGIIPACAGSRAVTQLCS